MLARLLFAVLLLSLPLFGQMSVTPTLALADNTAWCATGNCLTPLPATSGTLTEIKAGYDGTIYVLDAAVPYQLSAARVWTEVPTALQTAGGLPIIHVSVGVATQVLAQTAGDDNVYVHNAAGTAWSLLAGDGTCSDAEIGADGTIWCVNASNGIYSWAGGAWTGRGTGFCNLAIGNVNSVWATTCAGVLESWNGSAWVAASPAPSFTPSHAVDAIAAVGESSLAALDTSGGIHVFNSAGSGVWSTISGTASAIAGGGWVYLFTRDGGTAYHVNLVVPALTVAGSGSASCVTLDGGQVDCGNETLTVTAIMGATDVSTTNSGTEGQGVTATASATAQDYTCDPFYGSVVCDGSESGDMTYLCDITIEQGDVPGDCYDDNGPTPVSPP